MRMIDADARVTVQSFDVEHEEYDYTEMSVAEALDFATDEGCPPAVNAVPVVYAHWEDEPDRYRHWHCSNCGTVQSDACIAMNYCPHCGAQMAEHPWAASGCGQTFSPD